MIRIPIETPDRTRQGVLTWEDGEVEIDPGTLEPREVDAIDRELHTIHRYEPFDAIGPGIPQPASSKQLRGPGKTPAEFVFHARHLSSLVLLLMDQATGDQLADVYRP